MNRNENVNDFRIDLEDDDEISEEYLDEEAREEDVEKGIKGDEEFVEAFKVIYGMFCLV